MTTPVVVPSERSRGIVIAVSVRSLVVIAVRVRSLLVERTCWWINMCARNR
jgi:hypothetical protein